VRDDQKTKPIPTDDVDDQTLIERANTGDTTAFREIYDRHAPWAFAVSRRFVRGHADALDATQDAWAEFFSRFPGFVLTSKLRTYLYPVVKHASLRVTRRRKRFATTDDAPIEEIIASPHINTPTSTHPDGLRDALTHLSRAQIEVITLRYADGMTFPEIAIALGISLPAAKSRHRDALRAQIGRAHV